ncbi:MAG TPA: hypothetical protein VLN59_07315 [Burkholderiales bacterium]|nr:hypothetical protein [Burkholderiales bacterium]
MKWQRVFKSPIFPASFSWPVKKRKRGYESEATALIRTMLDNDDVREDQRIAWDRWRNDRDNLPKP